MRKRGSRHFARDVRRQGDGPEAGDEERRRDGDGVLRQRAPKKAVAA